MGYKELFHQLCDEKKFEEARILLMKNDYEAYDDPFYYTNMGWVLNSLERYQEALAYLNQALDIFGDDPWVYAQSGVSYVRLKNFDQAIQYFLKALKQGYDETWIHGELGHCYLQIKENEKAVEYLENALMDDEYNVWYLSQVAHGYLELKQYELAEEYYLKAAKIEPSDESYYDLAYYYSKRRNFAKQLEYLLLISDDFDLPWKNYQLAVVYLGLQNGKFAIHYVKEAIKLGIDDVDSHQLLADAYYCAKEYEKGNKEYRTCINMLTKANKYMLSRANYQDLVWISHKLKDWPLKLQFLDEAKASGFEDTWFQYHYARCLSELHEHARAIESIDYCMNHGVDEIEMMQLKAWNLSRLQKHQEAYDLLISAEVKHGGNAWFDEEIGMNLLSLKRYQEAIERLKKIEMTPYYLSMIGFSYFHLQQYQEAINYLKQALDQGKNNQWVYAMLGKCYQEINAINQAIEYYRIAYELDPSQEWIKEAMEYLQ